MPDIRLIDANATKEKLGFAIEPFVCSADDEIRNDTLLKAIAIVDSMPTEDSQPVKHGKWIADNTNLPSKNYTCSECMNRIQTKYYCWRCYIRYCDNCGATMDSERKEREA